MKKTKEEYFQEKDISSMQDLIQSKVTPQSQMVHGVENVQYRKKKCKKKDMIIKLFVKFLQFYTYDDGYNRYSAK